jgi:predicted RNA-binding protein with PUA-like domain
MEVKIHCSYHAIVNISELKEHPDNNNKHTDKQIERLSKIIKKNGWTSPITVSRLSGYITRGHARFMAAKKLRCRNIPVQYISYESPEHEYADATADNEIARWATLDLDKVRDKVLDFDDNFDLDLLGIKKFEMFDESDSSLNDIEYDDQKEKDGPVILKTEIECEDQATKDDLILELQERGFKFKVKKR